MTLERQQTNETIFSLFSFKRKIGSLWSLQFIRQLLGGGKQSTRKVVQPTKRNQTQQRRENNFHRKNVSQMRSYQSRTAQR